MHFSPLHSSHGLPLHGHFSGFRSQKCLHKGPLHSEHGLSLQVHLSGFFIQYFSSGIHPSLLHVWHGLSMQGHFSGFLMQSGLIGSGLHPNSSQSLQGLP